MAQKKSNRRPVDPGFTPPPRRSGTLDPAGSLSFEQAQRQRFQSMAPEQRRRWLARSSGEGFAGGMTPGQFFRGQWLPAMVGSLQSDLTQLQSEVGGEVMTPEELANITAMATNPNLSPAAQAFYQSIVNKQGQIARLQGKLGFGPGPGKPPITSGPSVIPGEITVGAQQQHIGPPPPPDTGGSGWTPPSHIGPPPPPDGVRPFTFQGGQQGLMPRRGPGVPNAAAMGFNRSDLFGRSSLGRLARREASARFGRRI